LKATNKYDNKIQQSLTNLKISQYKDNQQKLLSKDKEKIIKIILNRQIK